PDYRMEPVYLLPYKVKVCGPELLELRTVRPVESTYVIEERVDPDVYCVCLVKWKWYTPFYRGPRYADVLQTILYPVDDLLRPEFRGEELWVFIVKLEEPLLVLAQPEVVAFLLHFFNLPVAFGAPSLDELKLGPEGLVRDAVPSLVEVLVDVSCICYSLYQLRYNGFVRGVAGPYKIIVRYV